jgi:hypothetical protein
LLGNLFSSFRALGPQANCRVTIPGAKNTPVPRKLWIVPAESDRTIENCGQIPSELSRSLFSIQPHRCDAARYTVHFSLDKVRRLAVALKLESSASELRKLRMTLDQLLQQYEQGADLLRATVKKATKEELALHPVPGTWSIQQVVCHIADFEPVYADRMKRVLVEDNPTLFGGDPDVFAAGLCYEQRDVEEELDLITVVRKQMARILRQTDIEDFQRTGVHSESGPLTLETLLERITRHIPHHLTFIDQKLAAFKAGR